MSGPAHRAWTWWRRQRAWREEQVVRANVEWLAGPRTVAHDGELPIVLSLMKNGEVYVPAFLEHYRSLGCREIVLLDNGSTDATLDIARGDGAVTVLRATLPFDRYKRAMRRHLIRRFGRDRWCLCVDIDELFDYPWSGAIDLPQFLSYLKTHQFTAVVAQMLDMFPEQLTAAADAADRCFRDQHRFYDLSAIERRPYAVAGNEVAGPRIDMCFGGIRHQVFGFRPWLTKHPLFLCNRDVLPYLDDSHCVERARIADVCAVLYHYKFAGDFRGRVDRAVREGNYYRDSLEYRYYDAVMQSADPVCMRRPTGRVLTTAADLVESGFLVASERFRRFAASDPGSQEPGAPQVAVGGFADNSDRPEVR